MLFVICQNEIDRNYVLIYNFVRVKMTNGNDIINELKKIKDTIRGAIDYEKD